ncbi:MAG: hypothetical protein K9G62_03335 [Alphaproteobacteria bacterium]|nr:hypothetical protein [Alphaproteobacteria bacterium]
MNLTLSFDAEVSPLPSSICMGAGQSYEEYLLEPDSVPVVYNEIAAGMPPLELHRALNLDILHHTINEEFAKAARGDSSGALIINGTHVGPNNYKDFLHYIEGANAKLSEMFEETKETEPKEWEKYKNKFENEDYKRLMLSTPDRGELNGKPEIISPAFSPLKF